MQQTFSVEEYQKSFLSEERLTALYRDKLFKLFVPKQYGGLEENLETGARELIRVATVQGGLGWALNLGAGANWFSGFFPDQGAEQIFTDDKVVIAGSGFANGTFRKSGAYYYISGSWSRCSGAYHATFFSLRAKNESGEEKTFVVPRELVSITADDWAISGLRNASSYTISMQEVKIPQHFEFEINACINSHAYSIHDVPFEIFARVCLSASFIGIVKCLIDRSRELPLNHRSLDYISNDLEPTVIEVETSCVDWAKRVDNAAKDKSSNWDFSELLKADLAENNIRLFNLVQQLFLKGGLPFVEEDTLVHWAYRDVLTAVQHQMVKG